MSKDDQEALRCVQYLDGLAKEIDHTHYTDELYASMNHIRRLIAEKQAQAVEIERLRKDAERWRKWLKGESLTVVVPTPTDKNPASKTTIVYAPSPYAGFPEAMNSAIDSALNTKEQQP